jgi:hypothetical protein
VQAIIYLHGFNSSPHSHKAQIIQQYFKTHHPDVLCHVPALPIEPASAIRIAEELITNAQAQAMKVALIGSSLGGFYATYLSEQFNVKAALINPAVAAHELLVDEVGEQTNFHTGERYQFTHTYVEQLRALDVKRITHPHNFFVLLQTGDEVLDYQRAIALFSRSSLWVSGGGSHAFDGFEKTIPASLIFLRNVN